MGARWAGPVLGLLVACGGAGGVAAPEQPTGPATAMPVPDERGVRNRALERLGKRIYRALARGDVKSLLLDDLAFRRLLAPEAATRASAWRTGVRTRLAMRREAFEVLEAAAYVGVCVQGSRLEPAGSPVGLREPGWVLDRVLVAGEKPGGSRLAAWVEGSFLYTDAGFGAISLDRVEEPRWEHSDLDLAPCDMEVGIRGPQHVVGVTR
ncbi:MAG: hypothetical protein ACOCXM_02800 [Myxococcota bacterium]